MLLVFGEQRYWIKEKESCDTNFQMYFSGLNETYKTENLNIFTLHALNIPGCQLISNYSGKAIILPITLGSANTAES